MILDDYFGSGTNWEIVGTDISNRIIDKAIKGIYQTQRIETMPKDYFDRYCQRQSGKYEGFFQVNENLRKKVQFAELNLIKPLPEMGQFDVIFLRNVLIYFDNQTKERIISRLLSVLREEGLLFVGHSESLKIKDIPLKLIDHTSYQKTAG